MNIKDDASLALIPVAYKTSKLYSVIPNDNDGDFDYSGGTNGTRVNKGGFIEQMDNDIPRLDYPLLNGVVQSCPTLLLEPQSTNLITYSEDFSNSYWNKSEISVVDDFIISPDGTKNASKITINSSTPYLGNLNISLTTGDVYTISCFVKKGTNRWVRLSSVSSNTLGAWFDLENNVVGTVNSTSASIENYGNGWYRISNTLTAISGSNQTFLGLSDADGSTASTQVGNTVFAWGFQVEQKSYATSYIKTEGAAVTRSADDCVDAGTAADFNDSEGVFYVNAKIDDPSEADNNDFSLGDGSFVSNSVEISFKNLSASSQSIVGSCVIDGSSLSILPTTITDASIKHDLYHKVAYQYKQADFKMFVNGFKIGTSTYNDIFPSGALQRVSFEGNGTGGTKFRGNTREVMTFNTAMTDAQMEELTSYESFNQMAKQQLYTIE